MKFMKYSLIVLLISIAVESSLVFAYTSPTSTTISIELSKNTSKYTSYKTKNTYTTQSYNHTFSGTVLTSPCDSCKIMAKPYTADGDTFSGVLTTMGVTKNFPDDFSKQPGDYRLNIWRYDSTLLTTEHTAVWTIN